MNLIKYVSNNIRTKKLFMDYYISEDIRHYTEEEIEDMLNIYVNGLPLAFEMVYNQPKREEVGRCIERSEYLFYLYPESKLVRGHIKELAYKHDYERSVHQWIEKDGFIYDPTTLYVYSNRAYNDMYVLDIISSQTMEEYCQDEDNLRKYETVKNRTIDSIKDDIEFLERAKDHLNLLDSILYRTRTSVYDRNKIEAWYKVIGYKSINDRESNIRVRK